MSKKLVVFLALLGLVGTACGQGDTDVAAGGAADPAAAADGTADDGTADDGTADAGGSTAVPGQVGAEPVMYEEGTLGALLQAESARPTSGRFEGTIVLAGPAGSGMDGGSVTMSGAFDETDGSMELSIDLAGMAGAGIPPQYAGSLDEPAQIRVVDDVAYVQWGMLSALTGVEGGWLALPAEEVSGAGESYGVPTMPTNPSDLLAGYRAAAATTIDDLGTETIRGVETRHWRAGLDLAALAELADPAQSDDLRSELTAAGISELPVDVWLGVDDGQLRRFETELTVSDATGTGTVAVAFELFDLGADITVTPPPADEVIEAPSIGSF